jgi:hypothetical protein
VLVGLLAIGVATGNNTLVMLYAVAFLLGCAETIFDTRRRRSSPAWCGRISSNERTGGCTPPR